MGITTNNLQEAIEVASKAGFEGVEFSIHEAASLIDKHGVDHVRGMFARAVFKTAGWGMPVDWRGNDAKRQAGLAELPRLAKAAQALGCGRTMTWIMPCSDELSFDENRSFHVERMKPISAILDEHGCSFGL